MAIGSFMFDVFSSLARRSMTKTYLKSLLTVHTKHHRQIYNHNKEKGSKKCHMP